MSCLQNLVNSQVSIKCQLCANFSRESTEVLTIDCHSTTEALTLHMIQCFFKTFGSMLKVFLLVLRNHLTLQNLLFIALRNVHAHY